jgi:hypothetical protein
MVKNKENIQCGEVDGRDSKEINRSGRISTASSLVASTLLNKE